MDIKLYSIAVSHPARAAGLMLSYKGIDHEIVDILPGTQPLILRLHGFRGPTVPALKIGERRVQGSLNVSRSLESFKAEPRLFPDDSQQRSAVEDAERWGEAVLQPVPRNLFRWCLSRDREVRRDFAKTASLPLPSVGAWLTLPVSWYFARVVSKTTPESIEADLASLPAHLDHVEELIAAGVIGGEEPNAADFQIATSVRVLMNFAQLAPLIESRPTGELAMRIAPKFGRPFPIELPPEWVPESALSS